MHCALGEMNVGFHELDRALLVRDHSLPGLMVDPIFDNFGRTRDSNGS
jgi:hypothetical protein